MHFIECIQTASFKAQKKAVAIGISWRRERCLQQGHEYYLPLWKEYDQKTRKKKECKPVKLKIQHFPERKLAWWLHLATEMHL